MCCRYLLLRSICHHVQFWIKPAAKSQSDAGEVALLKQQLIDAVQATERGVSTTPEQREDIDRLITQLEPCELCKGSTIVTRATSTFKPVPEPWGHAHAVMLIITILHVPGTSRQRLPLRHPMPYTYHVADRHLTARRKSPHALLTCNRLYYMTYSYFMASCKIPHDFLPYH